MLFLGSNFFAWCTLSLKFYFFSFRNLLRNFARIIIALQRFCFIKLFWFALIYFFLTGVCSFEISKKVFEK